MELLTHEALTPMRPETKGFQRMMVLLRAALGALVDRTGARTPGGRRLQVLETLALGAKKQLVLVSCDGERFLVGAGAEQVQSIVRLGAGQGID